MSETPTAKLLDCWAPPESAGNAVGCIATTYSFDAALFEEECLARFLALDTDPNEDGALFLIEREEKLAALACAAVLVDSRRTRCRRSLRWDVLPVRLPTGAAQHAKITLLVWERLVRAVVASANLTEAGYLRQQEVFGVLDCPIGGDGPSAVLRDIVEFLDELVGLTAAADGTPNAAGRRCRALLNNVRERLDDVRDPTADRSQLHFVGLAPGRPSVPAQLEAIWPGRRAPDRLDVVSPFFDLGTRNAPAHAFWRWLKARRSAELCIHTTSETRPAGQGIVLHAPESLKDAAPAGDRFTTRFHRVAEADLPGEHGPLYRPLHAKSLLLANPAWRALLIGSSNFTSAGLGLGRAANIEANLCYTANARSSPERAAALDTAFLRGEPLDDETITLWQPRNEADEDDGDEAPALPAGFEDAEVFVERGAMRLRLRFGAALPDGWWVRAEDARPTLVDQARWQAEGAPRTIEIPWPEARPPAGLEVGWSGTTEPAWWPVNIRDALALPPVEELKSLSLDALMEILTSARPLLEVMRRRLRRRARELLHGASIDETLDPHRRVDTSAFLLQRARRASWAIAGLCEKLAQPVATENALAWRLHGPVGADALARALEAEAASADERTFLLGELALALAQVEPQTRRGSLPADAVRAAIDDYVATLVPRAEAQLSKATPSLARYVRQALAAAARRRAA